MSANLGAVRGSRSSGLGDCVDVSPCFGLEEHAHNVLGFREANLGVREHVVHALFMGATPTHLSKFDRVQATMERIGGFKTEPLATRREAALIALTLKQLDGDCWELLREYAHVHVLMTVTSWGSRQSSSV